MCSVVIILYSNSDIFWNCKETLRKLVYFYIAIVNNDLLLLYILFEFLITKQMQTLRVKN